MRRLNSSLGYVDRGVTITVRDVCRCRDHGPPGSHRRGHRHLCRGAHARAPGQADAAGRRRRGPEEAGPARSARRARRRAGRGSSVSKFGGAPEGEFAYVTIRVVAEHRRAGVGTMLDLRASEHARGLGKSRFYASSATTTRTRSATTRRAGSRRSAACRTSPRPRRAGGEPRAGRDRDRAGRAEHDRGAYEVALEADADIPSGRADSAATSRRGTRGTSARSPRVNSRSSRSRTARVVGFACSMRHTEDTYQHSMTGVARSARGRGVALALKQAQIAAAQAAGMPSSAPRTTSPTRRCAASTSGSATSAVRMGASRPAAPRLIRLAADFEATRPQAPGFRGSWGLLISGEEQANVAMIESKDRATSDPGGAQGRARSRSRRRGSSTSSSGSPTSRGT